MMARRKGRYIWDIPDERRAGEWESVIVFRIRLKLVYVL